jgi:phosphoglycolate phosphatase
VERLMAIKGILFDKDGTLIDLDGTWVPVYRSFLEQAFGLDAAGADLKMADAGYDPASQRFHSNSILSSGTTRQLVEHWWPDMASAQHDHLVHVIDVECAPMARQHLKPLFPLAPELAKLKDMGFILGVGTNDSHFSAMSQLAHLGISDFFVSVIGADTVERPKPCGDMIRRFAALTGLATREIAMVGDTLHDMEEARNGEAGMAIGVLSGSHRRQDFTGWADAVIDDVRELPAILKVPQDVL